MQKIILKNTKGKDIVNINSFDFSYTGMYEAKLTFSEKKILCLEAIIGGYTNSFFLGLDRLSQLLDDKVKELLWFIDYDESYKILFKKEESGFFSVRISILDRFNDKSQIHFEYEFDMDREQIISLVAQLKLLETDSKGYNLESEVD